MVESPAAGWTAGGDDLSTTVIAFALALGVCCGVGAQIFPSEDDYARLLSTRSLRCSFGWYASVGWNADKPSLETSNQEDFRFQIDAIDPPSPQQHNGRCEPWD